MKLSPAILEVMTHAHRTVGIQSSQLESAAAELFRRCLRLQKELQDQNVQMAKLAEKLQDLSSKEKEDQDGNVRLVKSPDERMSDAQERQKKLVAKYEAVRRKVGKAATAKRDLSSKEMAWIEEMNTFGKNVGVIDREAEEQPPAEEGATLDHRFDLVRTDKTKSLCKEANSVSTGQDPHPQPASRKRTSHPQSWARQTLITEAPRPRRIHLLNLKLVHHALYVRFSDHHHSDIPLQRNRDIDAAAIFYRWDWRVESSAERAN